LYRKLLEFGVRRYVAAKKKKVKIFIALVPFLPGNRKGYSERHTAHL